MDPIEKRFAFFGNAVAFAAHIRRPADFQFKAVASSVIPVTGGLAEAVSERQSYRPPNSEADLLSFTAASTRATGDYTDPRRAVDFTNGNYADNELSTLTLVEARVSGFKIAIPQDSDVRTFEVDELLARLESTSDRRTPNAFRGLDAVFTNVTVNGNQLKVNTATEAFTENETLEKLANTYEKNSDFRKQYGSLFYPTGQEQTGIARLLWKPHLAAELVVATVVTGFTWLTGPEAWQNHSRKPSGDRRYRLHLFRRAPHRRRSPTANLVTLAAWITNWRSRSGLRVPLKRRRHSTQARLAKP